MRLVSGLCIALTLGMSDAVAAPADKAPFALAAPDRMVSGGRAVQVSLRQPDIETTYDTGRVAESYGGGLLDYWIFDAFTRDRRETLGYRAKTQAEKIVVPLRTALWNFDTAGLALAATKAGLNKLDWFQAQGFTVNRDGDRAPLLATAGTPQFAFVDYRYEVSPDFTQIRVLGEISLQRLVRPKGASAATPEVIYRQRIMSVVQLATRSYEPRENAARWSADHGKLARAALTAAFGQFEDLLPYALGLSQKEIDGLSAKNSEKAFAAGFYGPLIRRDGPDNLLIWSKGLIRVQTIS